jgi:hypothetical protein
MGVPSSEDIPLPLVSADLIDQLLKKFMQNAKFKREHMMQKMNHISMMVDTCDKILTTTEGEAELKARLQRCVELVMLAPGCCTVIQSSYYTFKTTSMDAKNIRSMVEAISSRTEQIC